MTQVTVAEDTSSILVREDTNHSEIRIFPKRGLFFSTNSEPTKRETYTMEKLEILKQFQKIYGDKINPELVSVKYCQTETIALVELHFRSHTEKITTIDLGFICDDSISDDQTELTGWEPFFNPEADIVDNASRFLHMDDYSLINCIGGLFTEAGAAAINDAHHKTLASK